MKRIALTAASLTIMALLLFPFYWMLMTSIKPPSQIMSSPPIWVTRQPTLHAYAEVLTKLAIGRYLRNSLVIAFSAMSLTVALGVFAGYGLARFRIKGLKVFLLALLVSQLLPDVSLVLPLFIVFGRIGLLDTFAGVVLANVMQWLPFVVLILRPYFLKIPKTLEDAARIDGCSFPTAMMRIVIPLALPGIISAAILSFLFSWGEFVYALTFLSRNEMQPVTIGIYNAIGQYGIRYNSLMASSVFAIVPVVLVFIFFQRYIRWGLMVGGVKD